MTKKQEKLLKVRVWNMNVVFIKLNHVNSIALSSHVWMFRCSHIFPVRIVNFSKESGRQNNSTVVHLFVNFLPMNDMFLLYI